MTVTDEKTILGSVLEAGDSSPMVPESMIDVQVTGTIGKSWAPPGT
jgi:hypothetical protein